MTTTYLVDLTCMPGVTTSLTLGYLQAYAEADPRLSHRVRVEQHVAYLRQSIEQTWAGLRESMSSAPAGPQVVGFTTYFWNKAANLALARRIKAEFPDALVVLGGNEVTNQGRTLLPAAADVDLIIDGEGEQSFTDLLAAVDAGETDYRGIAGVTVRHGEEVLSTPPRPRLLDLDAIPSPFLSGACSIGRLRTSKVIIYELSRGCPFRCAFCHWGGAVGTKPGRFSLPRIRTDFEWIVANISNGSTLFLADANFGMTDADLEAAAMLTELLRAQDKSVYFFANWAKNTSRRVVRAASTLFRSGLISSVTLSAQSLNPEALQIAQRKNIPFEYYRQLQLEFDRLGIPTYTELIWGLPGETYESFRKGVGDIIEAGGTPVIYPLLLLANTEYNEPQFRQRHQIVCRPKPYQMFDSTMEVDTVVGHARLTYAEWLRGLVLGLAVAVFHGALLKLVMNRLHDVTGIPYAAMLEALADYCTTKPVRSSPLFQRVFRNFAASWDDASEYDRTTIDGILGRAYVEDHVHYQALVRTATVSGTDVRHLVAELTAALVSLVPLECRPPREQVDEWVASQTLIVRGIGAVCDGKGDVETDGVRIAIRRDFLGSPSDTFLLAIYHGSVDSRHLFQPPSPGIQVAATAV